MRETSTTITASALLALFAVLLSGCGGKAGSSSTPALPPPAPVAQNLVIATPSLPNGTYGQFYSSGLKASGGTPPYTWIVANGDPLSAGLSLNQNSGVLNGVLTADTSFTAGVFDAKSNIATHDFTINATSGAVKLMTTVLPPATVQKRYDISLAINQPDSGSFTLQSGQLPAGLNLSNAGELSGTPTATGTFNFSVKVTGNGGSSDSRALMLKVNAHTSRNETAQTATPISNGTWTASISPYAEPLDKANPDNDFYSVSAAGGSVISVNILAQRLNPPSALEPVLEILDASGNRLHTCNQAGDTDFVDDCMSDQIVPEFSVDAMLTLKVADSGNFFIHVLDWRGDARPDMVYEMTIFGAN